MRLGGPLFQKYDTPNQWVAAAHALGYRAAFCPVEPDAPEDVIRLYASSARENDIISNPSQLFGY